MVRDTSKASYRELIESGLKGRRKIQVYEALYEIGPCTANELFMYLAEKKKAGMRNQANIGTRLGELRDEEGLVFELPEKKLCSITKRLTIAWDVVLPIPVILGKKTVKKTKKQIIAELEARVAELLKENEELRRKYEPTVDQSLEQLSLFSSAVKKNFSDSLSR